MLCDSQSQRKFPSSQIKLTGFWRRGPGAKPPANFGGMFNAIQVYFATFCIYKQGLARNTNENIRDLVSKKQDILEIYVTQKVNGQFFFRGKQSQRKFLKSVNHISYNFLTLLRASAIDSDFTVTSRRRRWILKLEHTTEFLKRNGTSARSAENQSIHQSSLSGKASKSARSAANFLRKFQSFSIRFVEFVLFFTLSRCLPA